MRFFHEIGKLDVVKFTKWLVEVNGSRGRDVRLILPIHEEVSVSGPDADHFAPVDGKFKFIRTAAKKTPMLVPGSEFRPDSIVAVLAVESGYRGDANINIGETTGDIVVHGTGGTNLGMTGVAIVVLDPGQKAVFNSDGRGVDNIVVYENVGGEIFRTSMPRLDYEASKEMSEPVIEEAMGPGSLAATSQIAALGVSEESTSMDNSSLIFTRSDLSVLLRNSREPFLALVAGWGEGLLNRRLGTLGDDDLVDLAFMFQTLLLKKGGAKG